MTRPNLLFLTPMLPHATGSGSVIRAGITVEVLSRHFNVYVLHAEMWNWHGRGLTADFVRERSARYVHYVPQNNEIPVAGIMAEHFAGVQFHAVHTFRMVMARAAVSVLLQGGDPQPLSVIDLDDDECRRAERLIQLREQAGDRERALVEQRELPQLRLLERVMVPRFQNVCLAGLEDCERIGKRYPALRFVHLPNAVFPAATPPSREPAQRPPTFLFVGTLDYLPNEDGVHYFCTHILPLLREKSARPFRVRLVGAHPPPRVRELSCYPEVEVLANVPEVAPYYADADVVIVPIRAGSGTRIKILEAFNFRKPVVSTTIGAEGLAVMDGCQLLLADEPEPFAEACARLIEDPARCSSVAGMAWEWLQTHHSVDAVDTAIRSLYEPILQR